MNKEEGKVFIKFFKKSIEDRRASLEQGMYIAKDVDFIKIIPAGSTSLEVEREVDAEIKERFGEAYAAWKKGEEIPVEGTSVKNWPAISPAELDTLLHSNIYTVESLAGMSQNGLQRLGMGAVALQKRAQAWLEAAQNTGVTAAKIERLEVENSKLRDDVKDLQEKLALAGIDATPTPKPAPRKRAPRKTTRKPATKPRARRKRVTKNDTTV